MNAITVICLIGLAALVSLYQADTLKESVERGKSVYEGNCVSCHMADGNGLEGAFPPLANTGRLADKKKLVGIIVNGMTEPIKVNGVEYTLEMMPLVLTERETADVLNYIRNSWGNKNPEITVDEIKRLKPQKPH